MIDRFLVLSTVLLGALGAQPSAPSPIAAPLRELSWGQLNILHTTDTHGWHGGHLQEPQYSADWGDYISFAKHMRDKADDDGSDLLVVDTGDRIEGNGLYDASDPKGRYTFDIIKEQEIDIICSGNHELYKSNSSEDEFRQTVPGFKGSYIASNLDIYYPDTDAFEPLAPRFKKFTTKNQGIRIIAFGFLYDFNGNANNTKVQPVEETVKEQWFQDAIRDRDVDLFLVIGHVPVRFSKETNSIYNSIRKVQWDTPIQFLGGHTHIRDCVRYDSKAYGVESGRYMETIGFVSISGLSTSGKDGAQQLEPKKANPSFSRRYIDNNLYSMRHHSSKNDTTFATPLGLNVSSSIASARKTLNLDKTFGCAPHDYWLNRAPYPSNDSILTWLENEVLPDFITKSSTDEATPAYIITNTGAMRFDIFKGPFTIDTTFLVSPFTSGFRYLPSVPYEKATKILQLLNNEGPISLSELRISHLSASSSLHDPALREPDLEILTPARRPVSVMSKQGISTAQTERPIDQVPLASTLDHGAIKLTPGYTTTDDAGSDGDDTLHEPITFYDVPNCIAAAVPPTHPSPFSPAPHLPRSSSSHKQEDSDNEGPQTVQLVFNEFIQGWVVLALRYLGEEVDAADTRPYAGGKSFTDVISEWVGEHWTC
ncbi:Metallo-dependent phosphatase-like protein [Cryomyces antarcticus]